VEEVSTSSILLALASGIGVATSLAAAVIPARSAARVEPVYALQKGKYQVLSTGENVVRVIVATALGLLSLACLTLSRSRPIFYAGYMMTIVAALLLGPLFSLGLAKSLRPLLKWLRPVEGSLAADSLIQAPKRTSASVAALMLSLALVVAFSGMARANYASIIDWANTALNPDLFVLPTQSLDNRTTRFPATLAPEIAATPGVERVQMLRNGRIAFRGAPTMVLAMEMSSIAQTVDRRTVIGDTQEMYRKAAAGEGVIVSENFAELQGVTLGDVLEIPAPYGQISLPIVGIVVDYADQRGAILIDRSLFIEHWRDDTVNMFRVYVRPDAIVSDVRQRILARYEGTRQVFVLTNGELRGYIERIVGQWFGLTTVQVAVAVLVAILGIVNTLTVSITDRRRELGVLQAVGALHGQIRRTIWIEALIIGTLGLVLGGALGAINLYYILEIIRRDIAGMRLDYVFPVSTLLSLVPTILSAAFVAAIWPAESAVRGSLVEALEYE
jgi:putative ABC transport system permease protein